MKESSFQIIEQRILEIDYKTNSSFDFTQPVKVDYNINVNSEKKTQNSADVVIEIEIFKKKGFSEVPFYLTFKILGLFSWNSETNEEELEMLLNINAPAVLTSYARPFISQITLFSGYEPLIIPLINFTKK